MKDGRRGGLDEDGVVVVVVEGCGMREGVRRESVVG